MRTGGTYLFTGGGSGGHLFPGIAVALELKRREPEAEILFVGSEKELEQSILCRYEFSRLSLPVESLASLKRRPFRFLLRNIQAWRHARQILSDRKPSVVIGLGGYASAPIVWAAARSGLPVVLLEQNAIPGRTTRWLARSSSLICTSFSEAARLLPKSIPIELTGNPVRPEITALAGMRSQQKSFDEILILGGSQGAESLNQVVLQALSGLKENLRDKRIVHQSGPRQLDSIREAYRTSGIQAVVEPFFEDIVERYQSAILVISRAGATTLAELTCAGAPMILAPYPQSADNHQLANAQFLQSRGAAIIVEHRPTVEETSANLQATLRMLLSDSDRRTSMGAAAVQLSYPQAAERVADKIQELAEKYSH